MKIFSPAAAAFLAVLCFLLVACATGSSQKATAIDQSSEPTEAALRPFLLSQKGQQNDQILEGLVVPSHALKPTGYAGTYKIVPGGSQGFTMGSEFTIPADTIGRHGHDLEVDFSQVIFNIFLARVDKKKGMQIYSFFDSGLWMARVNEECEWRIIDSDQMAPDGSRLVMVVCCDKGGNVLYSKLHPAPAPTPINPKPAEKVSPSPSEPRSPKPSKPERTFDNSWVTTA